MSTATAADTHAHDDHEGGHEHPSDAKYIQVAAFLAVITGAEVALPYIAPDGIRGPYLYVMLIMMAVKFVTVVSWFMHLRFDHPLFKKLFYAGLILAVIVYAIALNMSHFFFRA